MAASTPGAKEGTWKPEPRRRKPDPAEAIRRHRLMQLLMMQGVLVVAFLGMAMFSWRNVEMRLVYLWSLVVPVGFVATYLGAFRRHERMVREGDRSPERRRREDRRGYVLLGVVLGAWLVGVALVMVTF